MDLQWFCNVFNFCFNNFAMVLIEVLRYICNGFAMPAILVSITLQRFLIIVLHWICNSFAMSTMVL